LIFVKNFYNIMDDKTLHPYAFNTGSTISGTTQVGVIAIGENGTQDFSARPGGVTWYMGPDESLGYLIVHPDYINRRLRFKRTEGFSGDLFLIKANEVASIMGHESFSGITDASNWLENSGTVTTFDNEWSPYWETRTPSGITLTWIDDYTRITFTDNSNGDAQHEIWSRRIWWGGTDPWQLVTTLTEGVTTYNDKTWQNATVEYRVRGKKSNSFSPSWTTDSINTPWVFKMNQTTLQTVNINDIHLYAVNKSVTIDWGDGTSETVTGVTKNSVEKNYTVSGNYFVKITGDVNWINYFDIPYPRTYFAGTDVTKWALPYNFQAGHMKQLGLIGVITNILYPPRVAFLDWDSNDFSEWNLTNFHIPSTAFEFNAMTNVFDNVFGDISTLVLPDVLAHLNLKGYIHGDLTNVIPFKNIYYGNAYVRLESSHPVGLTGDLSNWIMPDTAGGGHITMMRGTHFTKMPRGHFRRITNFGFFENSCDSAEIDSLLQYVDNYFTGDVVPLVNCTYILNGVGMGTPSAVGLAAKTSIENKYTTAGVTATISVNGLCNEYNTVLSAMTTTPSPADQTIQNRMIKALVDGGYYAKAEIIDIFATHNQNDSLINWKNPNNFNPTKQGNPAWEQYAGFTGAGTDAYIKTNFNPSTHGTIIGKDNVSIVFGIATDAFENSDDVFSGAAATSPIGCKTRAAVTNGYIRGYCNDKTQTAIVNTNAIGHYAYSRSSSAGYDVYKNSTKTYAGNASVAMASLPIDLIRSTKQMPYFMLFSSLTETEVQAVINIMEEYLDSYNNGLIT